MQQEARSQTECLIRGGGGRKPAGEVGRGQHMAQVGFGLGEAQHDTVVVCRSRKILFRTPLLKPLGSRPTVQDLSFSMTTPLLRTASGRPGTLVSVVLRVHLGAEDAVGRRLGGLGVEQVVQRCRSGWRPCGGEGQDGLVRVGYTPEVCPSRQRQALARSRRPLVGPWCRPSVPRPTRVVHGEAVGGTRPGEADGGAGHGEASGGARHT